jgi:hypothetical protein
MNLKIATRIIRGINDKLEELMKELEERKVDIAIILETRRGFG